MFYFYVLQNEANDLYYGYTNDLKRRLVEHNTGQSTFTKGHQWKLAYYEAYKSEKDARERERQIKKHGQAKAQLKKRLEHSLSKS